MKILATPVYQRGLDAADPFARDAFNREIIARNLTRLFRASSDGLVISIDAKWGEGKTSFIRFWELLLSQENDFIPIYYDAFRHDFASDPFVSIAAAIHGALSSRIRGQIRERATKAELLQLKKASKALAIDLAKMTAGLAVASLSGGLVRSTSLLDWLKKAFEKLSFGTLEVNAEEQFETYLRSQDSVHEYQLRLREILSPGKSDEQRKIVFFIDELDRCRPGFAVEILERVKHLFNVPNVFFVLSMNREQLLKTIGSVYGIDPQDASIYLQKFVDFETRLPSLAEEALVSSEGMLKSYLQDVARELGLWEGPLSIMAEIDTLAYLLSAHLKLSPRSIERVMSFIALGLGSCEQADALRLRRHIVVSAAVRVGAPAHYKGLLREGAFWDSRVEEVNLYGWARQYFEAEKEDRAANVFVVPQMREASRILDMYELPERSLDDRPSEIVESSE